MKPYRWTPTPMDQQMMELRRLLERNGGMTAAAPGGAAPAIPPMDLPAVENPDAAKAFAQAMQPPAAPVFGDVRPLDVIGANADRAAAAGTELAAAGKIAAGNATGAAGAMRSLPAGAAAAGAAGGPMGMLTGVGGMLISTLLSQLLKEDEATPVAGSMQLQPGAPYEPPVVPSFNDNADLDRRLLGRWA
ncbi:MAG: hypothetical protein HZC54_00640 [Verrucomicrobia bacterium]|nr:hypothetical protein [Verrucomicrobiota bacterium]